MAARLLCCGSVLLLAATQVFASPIGIDFDGTTFGAELCYNDLDCPTTESAGDESLDIPNASLGDNTISEDGLGATQRWAVLASQELDPGDATKASLDFEFVNLNAQNIQADKTFIIRILNLDTQPSGLGSVLALDGPVTGEFIINGLTQAWEFPTDFSNAQQVQWVENPAGQFDLELDFGTNGVPGLLGVADVIQNIKITVPVMIVPEPATILLLLGFGLCLRRGRRMFR